MVLARVLLVNQRPSTEHVSQLLDLILVVHETTTVTLRSQYIPVICCSIVYYSGVANTGITDSIGYATGDISLMAMDFSLFEMMPIPLCDASLTAGSSNANQCPGDGSYDYSVVYNLPKSGADSASWLASGWSGTGYLEIYAAQDQVDMLIGKCTIGLKTSVTHSSATQGLFQTPSAATTTGIVLGALAAAALVCVYCYCCCKKRQKTKKDLLDKGDDVTSSFRRMDDDIPKSVASGKTTVVSQID
jgi:hypothetical protein